ncbi:MAG: Retron-type RNA-directed polymerase [Edaphobacter sp.]|nr:Retron-type RNA-directed polymerase [Edaphobacter sp.]
MDGQTFRNIEAYGAERWLDELMQELESRTYRPLPVRRVFIPKPGGKQRPLGVPAIRDGAVEMAAVLVLEPIFEADLQLEQYAYRRGRSALDAVNHVHKLVIWPESTLHRLIRQIITNRMLPALAAYMGPVGLGSTERYLFMPPEWFRKELDKLSPTRGKRCWLNDKVLMKFLAAL